MPAAPVPSYAAAGLADVLPGLAASLGVPVRGDDPAYPSFDFAPTRRAVVVLVDGLGDVLLRRRAGHAPWLRTLLPGGLGVSAGFPSTTATSMGTFGTGRHPGGHGLLGYEVLVPGEDRLLNELSWEDGPVPEQWQPERTVFESLAAAGVAVTRIGPGYFDGSGLTRAALRGGRFVAAASLRGRVDAALAAVRAQPRSLVYLYWGELDKVGHVHGCASWEWGDELEAVDAELSRLASLVPGDCSVTITADHGMVDAPHDLRLDLAHDDVLAAGVRHLGGEPRACHVYAETGAADDVLATWQAVLADRGWVVSREQAIADGWFGSVTDGHRDRIGDVVAAMKDTYTVLDSRRMRPEVLALLGMHGSLTDDEVRIPVLHVPARSLA